MDSTSVNIVTPTASPIIRVTVAMTYDPGCLAMRRRLSRNSLIGYRSSVIGHRSSVIGYRLSVIGYRLSGIGHRGSGIGHRASGIGANSLIHADEPLKQLCNGRMIN